VRDAPFLHAKHLDEAVRRGVISSEQREALEALARTLHAEAAGAGPELGWFRGMLAGAAGAAAGLPGLIALASVTELRAHELVAAGLAGLGAAGGGALALRDRREHVMVKGVLAAAATGFAWLLGAGAGLAVFDVQTAGGAHTRDAVLPLWTVPGDAAVLAAAAVLGRGLRAPTVALPAAVALAHAVLRVGLWRNVGRAHFAGAEAAWDGVAQLPWWIAATLALTAAARALDRRAAREVDAGFWVHLVAPGPALLGLAGGLEQGPPALALAAPLLCAAAFALAFRWRRLLWAAWGALGVMALPMFKLPTSSEALALAFWVPLTVALFTVVALAWRRHEIARAAPGAAEPSVWG